MGLSKTRSSVAQASNNRIGVRYRRLDLVEVEVLSRFCAPSHSGRLVAAANGFKFVHYLERKQCICEYTLFSCLEFKPLLICWVSCSCSFLLGFFIDKQSVHNMEGRHHGYGRVMLIRSLEDNVIIIVSLLMPRIYILKRRD